ncbi:hypothetical protein [Pseudomonas sp. I3-I5]|uniref:hypothetical protein n=1 Tax=Pseudomonas sp. I3-I5 TaxID=2926671 RepID=UPI001F60A860|nr:hypothetical protein [Pseudomonas sp. I3-I5]UNT14631.1 hypothetical protein MOP87_05275 [Pseudomonas sp. I3-I5]
MHSIFQLNDYNELMSDGGKQYDSVHVIVVSKRGVKFIAIARNAQQGLKIQIEKDPSNLTIYLN